MSFKNTGDFLSVTGGFGGTILKFEGDSVARLCVKIPKKSLSVDPMEAARRFLKEIRFQRNLYFHRFVHWPADFDFVFDTPIAWFRFWDGDLSDLVDDLRVGVINRLALLSYIATGLLHCHSRGLVAHQDLKPENIFIQNIRTAQTGLPDLDVFTFPKIADFGSVNLARDIGEFRGTRPYMAPEQWAKEPLGQHTTVWSMGLLTYELLSIGKHPIGELTRPWRQGLPDVHKRWQKDRMWRRWIDSGALMSEPLLDGSADNLVKNCMKIDTLKRPSLVQYINEVNEIIRKHSPEAADQVAAQVHLANLDSMGDHDWPYQDSKLNRIIDLTKNKFQHIDLS